MGQKTFSVRRETNNKCIGFNDSDIARIAETIIQYRYELWFWTSVAVVGPYMFKNILNGFCRKRRDKNRTRHGGGFRKKKKKRKKTTVTQTRFSSSEFVDRLRTVMFNVYERVGFLNDGPNEYKTKCIDGTRLEPISPVRNVTYYVWGARPNKRSFPCAV